jgi:biopolymer transport protein ExbB
MMNHPRAVGRALGAALVLAIVLGAGSRGIAPLLAQPKGEKAGEAAAARATGPRAAAPAEEPESLGRIILEKTNWIGHLFYITLALFSVMALAVALERLVHLRRAKVVPAAFVEELRAMRTRAEDTPQRMAELCARHPSPVANILRAGLLRAGRPLQEVEKAMEDAAARELSEVRSRSRVLNVLGTVAPLVGLHGTVVGMIFAFYTSSKAGLGKAELLAEGIYLALLTTAAGLTIAIPSLLLVAWFHTRAERYFREIDEALMETFPSFARMETAGAGPGFSGHVAATLR